MVRRFAGWLGRRTVWSFVAAWTLVLAGLLVYVEVETLSSDGIASDAVAFYAFFVALALWLVGLVVIAALAWLLGRFRPRPAANVARPAVTSRSG